MRHFKHLHLRTELAGNRFRANEGASEDANIAALVPPVASGAKLDPVILTRANLDEKVITLRLIPRVATSIRMPEPVNSVVIGDPEHFQAEHSET